MLRYLTILLLLLSCKRYIPTTVPVTIPADSMRFTTSICDTLHDTVTHRVNNTTVRLIREPGALHVRVVRDSIRTTVQTECPPPPAPPWWLEWLPWVLVGVLVLVVVKK